ncbi:MAG: hypothetical protein AAGK93_00110 [Pseudomonadota bacterium]
MATGLDPVWTWVALLVGAATLPAVWLLIEAWNWRKRAKARAEQLHKEHLERQAVHQGKVDHMQAQRER